MLDLFGVHKIAAKAARETGFVRAEKGAKIPGWKLAKASKFRKWKTGAERHLKREFGEDAYEPKKLKSPAQLEAIPKGKTFTQRWAFKPDGGNQLVPERDIRHEVSPATKSMFKPVAKKGSK